MLQHENAILLNSPGIWTADQTFNDNVKLLFGTLGADGEIYSDGDDMFFNQLSGGGIMVGMAASPPSPDLDTFHIWRGSAGAITSHATGVLVVESSAELVLQLLVPDDVASGIAFGGPTSERRGLLRYLGPADSPADTFEFNTANATRFQVSAGAFAFQEATVISSTAGALTWDPTTDVLIVDGKGLVIGHTAQISVGFGLGEFQVLGTAEGTDSQVIIGLFATSNTQAPNLSFIKSGNAIIGSNTIVADNELLGDIKWHADDGNDYVTLAARIRAEVDDGSPASSSIGAALILSTAAGLSSNDITERLRVTAEGRSVFAGAINLGAAVSLTIASGVIARTTSYHTLVVEGGAGSGADSLATATGGVEGDLLILKVTTSGANDQVTISDGTGADTFILAGGADFIMDHVDDRIEFIHNGTEWVERTRSSNS